MFVGNYQKRLRKTVKISQTWVFCIKNPENYLQKCEIRCTITLRKRLSTSATTRSDRFKQNSNRFKQLKEEVNGYGIYERYFSSLWSICRDR